MYIASQLRKTNIAEYILYMWQIEDIIRGLNLDIDLIDSKHLASITSLSPEQHREYRQWYESLIDMMRREDVTTKGHLQMNRNVVADLVELHRALLDDPRFSSYHSLYYRTLPSIVELRAKAGSQAEEEINTCLTALYGLMLLRLQGKEVSPETTAALADISRLVGTLAAYYKKNEEKPLFVPDDETPLA